MTAMNEQAQVAGHEQFTSENVLPLLQTIADLVDKRCHRFLNRRYGLTMPQYQLLLAALMGEASTLGALADELNCSRGNLTGVADRLERDGWLNRERSTEDRRVVNIRLTDKGSKVWEIQRELAKEMAQMAAIWAPQEQAMLMNSLQKMYMELKRDQPEELAERH
jgi:DNA-binding MarR family transcriptional regulator